MPDPSIVSDSKGEWIEIYNTTDSPIDLDGLKIMKNTTQSSVTFLNGSIIEPLSYFVIARKEASISKLPQVDATASFSLTNPGANLSIILNGEILDSVHYISSSRGKSWQVDPDLKDHDLNDYELSWCKGSTEISDDNTDKGTPGSINVTCQ
jgi:hypothetical protein